MKVKRKVLEILFAFAIAALLIAALGSPLALSQDHRKYADGQAASQFDLSVATATDTFLRTNSAGRVFLYTVHLNRTILMLDVTNGSKNCQA